MADKDFIVKNGLVTGSNTVTIGTAVYLVSNGNVGFGTSTPGNKIAVSGSITATANISSAYVNASSGFTGTVLTATQGTIDHNSLSNYSSDRHIAHSGVSVSAGNGLTGGGDITTSRTISANPGNTQLIANSSGLWIDQSKIDHNSLTNYVGNRHIDHTSVSISTANGLSGGGDISATRTLTVTAGTGVVVNATGVHVNSTYIGTISANNTTYVNGKTEGNLNVNSASYATSAGSATNAGYATSAGSASSATNASSATYATSAGSATNATYATSAGSATNATYATSAGSATNATYAGTAGATTTGNSFQMGSLGVGTAASGTGGEIRATNDITAFYSDKRLKTNISTIENALQKINQISGVKYQSNELAASFGYTNTDWQVGVIAQEVQKVLPECVRLAPFDSDYLEGKEFSISGENYLTVKYEKLVPLLIEAIKELSDKVEKLEKGV